MTTLFALALIPVGVSILIAHRYIVDRMARPRELPPASLFLAYWDSLIEVEKCLDKERSRLDLDDNELPF